MGSQLFDNAVLAAPMAGVSDLPYRNVCRSNGADLAVAEMLTSNMSLYETQKSKTRLSSREENGVRMVQLVGTDAAEMASAARYNEKLGADIIDINMGCPAKKVCRKAAGSALLAQPQKVEGILRAVVDAVSVPVTLKMRTGIAPDQINALEIANIAQDCGVAALTIHGRTRACRFGGNAEYDTIAKVKQSVALPIVANGDIDCVDKALWVKHYTNADALMIGRAAQGQPWLFRQISAKLKCGVDIAAPSISARRELVLDHLRAIYNYYPERLAVRMARKHIKSYLRHWPLATDSLLLNKSLTSDEANQQFDLVATLLQAPLKQAA